MSFSFPDIALIKSISGGTWIKQREGHSDKDNFLGLIRLLAELSGSLSWPGVAEMFVGSETSAGECGGVEEGLSSDEELCVVVEASVFVVKGDDATDGCSLGFLPRFLPAVAPFLTSALSKLFSTDGLLLPLLLPEAT